MQPPGVCVPFWMMKVTAEEDDSNMVLVKAGKLLVARNPEPIEAGDDLVLFRPETAKRAPEPLQAVSSKRKKN